MQRAVSAPFGSGNGPVPIRTLANPETIAGSERFQSARPQSGYSRPFPLASAGGLFLLWNVAGKALLSQRRLGLTGICRRLRVPLRSARALQTGRGALAGSNTVVMRFPSWARDQRRSPSKFNHWESVLESTCGNSWFNHCWYYERVWERLRQVWVGLICRSRLRRSGWGLTAPSYSGTARSTIR